MALSSVTRYPGGVNNAVEGTALGDLKFPNRMAYNVIEDDFNAYTAANWTVAGTAAGVPALLAGGDGGIVNVVTTATNPSETSLSLPNLTITPDITKDLFIAARLKLDNATLGGFLFGIGVVTASPMGVSPVNGIYVRKLTGTFTPQAVLRLASADAAIVTAPSDMASDTWFTVGISYTAADGVLRAHVNDGSVRIATAPASLGAAPMSLMFSARNSTAAIRTLSIDNYIVAKGR